MKKCLRFCTLIFKYNYIGLFFFNGQHNLSIVTKYKINAFQMAKKNIDDCQHFELLYNLVFFLFVNFHTVVTTHIESF